MNNELPEFEQGSVKKAMQGVTSSDLWKVPRDRLIVQPGFNVRMPTPEYKAHIRQIADSIKANGYMQDKPIAGYVAVDGKGVDTIIVTDGHSRLAAFDLAVSEGWEGTELPVVTKPRGTSMEDLTIALVTSNNGRPLSPFEIGMVAKRLVGYGMEPKDIAIRLGYTKQYIDGLLDVVAAPKAIRDLVSSGKVSTTLAVETIKKHGKEAGKVLSQGAQEATASGKDRVTKKHVNKATTKAEKKTKAGKDNPQEPLQGDLLAGTPVDPRVAQIEAGAKWFRDSGYGDDMKDVLISYTAQMMSLSQDDVAAYFQDEL